MLSFFPYKMGKGNTKKTVKEIMIKILNKTDMQTHKEV